MNIPNPFKLRNHTLETDILIIGGGTAGCFSALTIAEKSRASVIIAEKANIKRSGCLASGVNALNAYINEGETPGSYVDYVKEDSKGIIRDDLVYTIALRLNQVTKKLEELGVPILKDEDGNYVARGKRSIKINGENIKPILAKAVQSYRNVKVLNRVNIIDYIVYEDRVIGAYGFSLDKKIFYTIIAKAVICTTGGASGLYKPNSPGFSRHKMWYCPYNTGAGYAMGIRAGAEMTSLEMRFIALRCKDTISPTGTIANGVGAKQVNRLGEQYLDKYDENSTPLRLHATVLENKKGNGPCYLETKGITEEEQNDLYRAYLNMSLAQTLKWIESGKGPKEENVEIEGTEPYIVGGHSASGYWVDIHRQTTLPGLFAAGDVAGGSPKKYVTGCIAEGEIAAESAIRYINLHSNLTRIRKRRIDNKISQANHFFRRRRNRLHEIEEIEEAMQNVMDKHVGGISQNYLIDYKKLPYARQRIDELLKLSYNLRANDMHQLMFIYEIIDRLFVCKSLIYHIEARKESRWGCYMYSLDYPDRDDETWLKYVNTVYQNGTYNIIIRDLVGREEVYEHSN